MMLQVWFLGLFIAIITVIVAFTLRKENEEMPRKEILRAVESTGKLGLVEKSFLWVFSWLDTRFRIQDYWAMSRDSYHSMHRQMPLTHSEKYKLRIIWYWYPLYCLGGISFLAFIVLVITGTILGIYYVPGGQGDPTPAYASMEFIMTQLPFGYIIRSIHHWATHFMVAAVFLHMCRVYFTGAYRNPRELNWLIGVGLMFFTIFFGYSGYLLPWDSLAFGAATIGINMANSTPLIGGWVANAMFGGTSLSYQTVTRMYFLHVFILPVVVTALIIIHLFIVWVQGIAEPH
jgi:quinol-cytochrome oxidoreductase complex cytochrome b subunit